MSEQSRSLLRQELGPPPSPTLWPQQQEAKPCYQHSPLAPSLPIPTN